MVYVKYPLPAFTVKEASDLALRLFGLPAVASPLPSERDQNFLLQTSSGRFVLKISNVLEERQTLDLQNAALEHLAGRAPEIELPRLKRSANGDAIATTESEQGTHLVRLFTYVPGRLLAQVKPKSPQLLQTIGIVLAGIDRALLDFDHPAARRKLKWDIAQAGWIRDYISYISDSERRKIVERHLQEFETRTKPLLENLRASVIYNDANDHNVLVSQDGTRAIGVLDFGDMVYTQTICDLAVGVPYAVFGKPDILTAACEVVRGYHSILPLLEAELQLLFPLICARMCISVVNSAYQRTVEPDNRYLTISEEGAWDLLYKLNTIDSHFAYLRFRHACGLPATANALRIRNWLEKHGSASASVLQATAEMKPAFVLDLSPGSNQFGTLGDILNTANFASRVSALMGENSARVAIGRYNEARILTIDQTMNVAGNDRPEARTLHLGIDLFAEAGTDVFAPIDGVIHSFRNNSESGDYGPVIVLQHDVEGTTFYTLYAHLSIASLENLKRRRNISRGEIIGKIGATSENGGWPPHLHFQIIADMMGNEGTFEAYAAPAQRDFWNQICPDPNLLLHIPGLQPPGLKDSTRQLMRDRSERISQALSISYIRPLHIVRGWLQHLFDADGQPYLDAVNNVAHVGHCHPKVVRAAQQQIAVLNTNTRYLHENLAAYANRLIALLPESLSVCFFVNSGSEANELAIRLARAHTKQKDMLVLEGGYHGNTTTLIEMSSYKFLGPGGSGAPPYVHTLPLADTYRGRFKRNDPDAAEKYASFAAETIAKIRQQNRGVCGFLHETMPSTAGQIVFPPGYLQKTYGIVRQAGGVCIADEVQTGFGRLGSHFWAFETQGVVPDIITLGKPIGNGHPLGAVITTKQIADSFLTGMEFFSTFGGNPVSCATGMAVLDVIQEERLQENARDVGTYLLEKLNELSSEYSLIGDVRGMGLYAGVELVCNSETLQPAAKQAGYIVNRMKDRGVLISIDGVLHNVLKIRPPMIFTKANVDQLIQNLHTVLSEDAVQP